MAPNARTMKRLPRPYGFTEPAVCSVPACAANTVSASSGGPAASTRPVTQMAPTIAAATPTPRTRRATSCPPSLHGDDQSRRSVGYKAGAESRDRDLNTSVYVDRVASWTVDTSSRHSGPAWVAKRRLSERSEEHTSELQSLRHLVCRLLLEKKKEK